MPRCPSPRFALPAVAFRPNLRLRMTSQPATEPFTPCPPGVAELRPGISNFTRLLVSWPGALQGPTRPNLSTGAGELRMVFFLLLFLFVQARKRPRRWATVFWGTPLMSPPRESIPKWRPRVPRQTFARMTPYSLIRQEAEAA
jgi:hypothetical protein